MRFPQQWRREQHPNLLINLCTRTGMEVRVHPRNSASVSGQKTYSDSSTSESRIGHVQRLFGSCSVKPAERFQISDSRLGFQSGIWNPKSLEWRPAPHAVTRMCRLHRPGRQICVCATGSSPARHPNPLRQNQATASDRNKAPSTPPAIEENLRAAALPLSG